MFQCAYVGSEINTFIYSTPEDQEVEAGRDVRIPCQVVSREEDDNIEIVWTKDDVRIVPSRSKHLFK